MKGQDKTKEQLIGELDKMRQQISTLKRQITKLKQANLENVRFRAISEKANYGISLVDSDGKYIYKQNFCRDVWAETGLYSK